MKNEPIQVNIFGTEYSLKGSVEDPEYMKELAGYVDKKMQGVSKGSALVSTAKVAVLAALRITDELHQLEAEKDGKKTDNVTKKRLQKLIEMIDRKIKD